MKLNFLLPALLPAAALALPQLLIQDAVAPALDVPHTDSLPSLSIDDFVSIQERIADSLVAGLEQALMGGPEHGILDFSDYTIPEILNASLHHKHPEHSTNWPWHHDEPTDPSQLPFHRLASLVNRSESAVEALSKDGITLLAPDDYALTPPDKREHHEKKDEAWILPAFESDEGIGEEHPLPHPFFSHELRGKTCKRVVTTLDEDEERKERIARIIGFLIKYHTLPFPATEAGLEDHSTVASSLGSGEDDAEPLRIHVEPSLSIHPFPHPTLTFNFYASKRGPTIKAKNGYIHLISGPLLPPLTPLNEAFLFPQIFSTLTSGVQKVGLDEVLLPSSDDEQLGSKSASMVQELIDELVKEKGGRFTVFAPTNLAFVKLGPKVLAFLHSPLPISKRILKYILSYHIVPDIAFYSDYINNQTALSPYQNGEEVNLEGPMPGSEDDHDHGKYNVTHYVLPTLLSTLGRNSNAMLAVDVFSYRLFGKGPIRRAVVVLPAVVEEIEKEDHHDGHHGHHGHHEGPPARPVRAWKPDVPARNGAIHVINDVLRPPHPHHDKKSFGPGDRRMSRAFEELFA